MSAAEPSHQTLADLLDANVRRNVRMLTTYGEIPASALYEPLVMSRQTFSAKLTGHSRFTAAEVAMLAHLLGVRTDRLYGDPDEMFRATEESTPTSGMRQRLLQELGPTKRSRCLSILPAHRGQMELPLLRLAALAAV